MFEPSAAIAAIPERSGMSDEGKFYFYVTHPRLEEAAQFNADCRKDESASPVIGCYAGATDTIHIYDITNKELDGIKEVTAAHEMLHAVWARLSITERSQLEVQLHAAYDRVKTPALEARIAHYAKAGEAVVTSELYAILPTEVKDIGEELESHYQRYFNNRQKVVALYASYSAAFELREAELSSLSLELYQQREDIGTQERSLSVDIAAMNKRVETFNTRAADGDFASLTIFNQERGAIVTEQSVLTSRQQALDQLIDAYNQKVQRFNDLGGEMDRLTRSVDSMQGVGK